MIVGEAQFLKDVQAQVSNPLAKQQTKIELGSL